MSHPHELNVSKSKQKMPETKGKSLFIEFVESTTLHGIRYVFRGDSKIRRFIWFLCILSCVVGCVWNFTNLLQSYLNNEFVTRVSVVDQDNVTFPAVTICNFNPIRASYLKHLNLSDSAILAQYMLAGEETADHNEDFDEFSSNYTDAFFLNGSHHIKDMLLNCTLQGEECLPDDFQQVLTNMGSCYTFNFGTYAYVVLDLHDNIINIQNISLLKYRCAQFSLD